MRFRAKHRSAKGKYHFLNEKSLFPAFKKCCNHQRFDSSRGESENFTRYYKFREDYV